MDILSRKGEFSSEDLLDMKAMSHAELVAFVSATNKSWYLLLESLEEAHRQDLERLTISLTEQSQAVFRDFKKQLSSLEEGLEHSTDKTRKNSEKLARLTNICEGLLKKYSAES